MAIQALRIFLLSLLVASVDCFRNREGLLRSLLRRADISSSSALRVVQWNVFEDGLTETPGNIGFDGKFEKRFSSLLSQLSTDEHGKPLLGFRKTRDYRQLPRTAAIDSTRNFFDFIDVFYSAIYHSLRGEARFGSSDPGDPPDFQSSLLSLFIRCALPDSSRPPSATNQWVTPAFERELYKVNASAEVEMRLRSMRENAFDATHGSLIWDRDVIDGKVWKRSDNVWVDKWMANLAIFHLPPADIESTAKEALSRFINVGKSSDSRHEVPRAMVSLKVDDQGNVQRVHTLTLQSAVWWLLLELCKHSSLNPVSAKAISAFSGIADIPEEAEERAMLILPEVLRELETWFEESALSSRSEKMHRVVEDTRPDIITAVEFDEQWRRQDLPQSKNYSMIPGKGTAAILFDAEMFDHVEALDDLPIPRAVPTIPTKRESLADDREYQVTAKSSCVVLLRRKHDSMLFLVVAVHMESAPPSATAKVELRSLQLKATLTHISKLVQSLASNGQKCVLVFAGDMNAMAEEFVYGNGEEFFQAASVISTRPPLHPPKTESRFTGLHPPLARVDSSGGLRLFCSGSDGGELLQATRSPDVTCTRAGSNMVIDAIFVGSVGVQARTTPLVISTHTEAESAADPEYGIYNAVMRWGSDHLPVGTTIFA